jgi:HlyD family secretion protein
MKKKKPRWLIIILIILGITAYAVFAIRSGQKNKNAGTIVEVSKLARGEMVTTVSGSGLADTVEKEEIRAEVSGLISKIYIKEGDRVKKGDLLLTFDDYQFIRALESAENALKVEEIDPTLEEAQLQLETCKRIYNRVALLYQQGAATKVDLEDAALKLEQAEVRWKGMQRLTTIKQEEARLALAAAREELAKTSIKASRDGKVLYCPVKEGTSILPGTFLCEIGNIQKLSVEFPVDEIDISQIKPGQEVKITHDGLPGMELLGEVEQVALKGITRGSEIVFPVKILIDNQDGNLRPGMTVDVEIITASVGEALTIPLLALVEDEEPTGEIGKYVFKVIDDTAVKTSVKTGLSNESRVEVLEGLLEQDSYVSGDYDTILHLKDGTKVRPKKSDNK